MLTIFNELAIFATFTLKMRFSTSRKLTFFKSERTVFPQRTFFQRLHTTPATPTTPQQASTGLF